MPRFTLRSFRFWILPLTLAAFALAAAAQVSPDLYSGLQWRNIGPFHGGRVAAVSGPVGDASLVGTFYIGLPQGGVWKTTSAGTTWYPVFDDVNSVDSIGAIAVTPSNPNIIYAGSGDAVANASTGTDGDGMYKSTDAGKTWARDGLDGTRRITSIVVDPRNPDLVVVAALAGETGTQKGVFRTEDGGKTWQNVLHPDDKTGGRDLSSPYDMPNVIFATTIEDSPAPAAGRGGGGGGGAGGRGAAQTGPNYTRLYKSLDEGKTWTEVTVGTGINGRICVAVAMHTNAQRIYVYGSGGLARSDDQGATWKQMAATPRGSGYTNGVWADTQNPDIVFANSTASYKSTDGGATFIPFKGAPGGEDFHEMWIDPTNDHRMAMGVDQGAPVSLDAGLTWSSYYALPNDQVYHISTDNRYPYWVMASQQDTGSIMVRDRGDMGQVSEEDWLQIPASEFGTVIADPLAPETLYGVGYGTAGGGSELVKINMHTGQWENVAPNYGAGAEKYRGNQNAWRRFDPFDPHALYTSMQCLVVSRDGGHTWKDVSPDLTTPKDQPQVPCGTRAAATAAPAAPAGGGRGGGGASILDFALSTLQKGVFWTVSSNGQIDNSLDNGAHWNNVSNLPDATGDAFNNIEAGHNDINTAYVSAHAPGGLLRAEGNVPLIWRTHDGGKTWTKIVNGLPTGQPSGSWINVVREDPKQKGLLFAGSESTVYVSFDDGDHWQTLRQNLPTTSIRDMVFHTDDNMNDLVVGTYGRSFWVLDDMTPLREIAQKSQTIAAQPAYFFKPGDAIRSRVSFNWGQPFNPEMPHSPNPPFGAIFYYHLSRPPQGELKLQIFDASGNLVRTISSVPPVLPASFPYPSYWVAKPSDLALPTQVGTDRFNWDLRYDDPPAFSFDLENQMNVSPGGFVTPGPHGMMVIPGVYTMKLTVDGKTYIQTVTVHNDPRVGDSPAVLAALKAKDQLIVAAWHGAQESFSGNGEVATVRAQVAALNGGSLPADVAAQATALDTKLATFGGVVPGRGGRGGGGAGGRGRGAAAPAAMVPFNTLNASFDALVSVGGQVGIDEAPTPAEVATWEADCRNFNTTVIAWKAAISQDVVAFNAVLNRNNLKPLAVTATQLTDPPCTLPAAGATAARNR